LFIIRIAVTKLSSFIKENKNTGTNAYRICIILKEQNTRYSLLKINQCNWEKKKKTADTLLPVTLLFSLLSSVPGQHREAFQQSFYHSSQQATSNNTTI